MELKSYIVSGKLLIHGRGNISKWILEWEELMHIVNEEHGRTGTLLLKRFC